MQNCLPLESGWSNENCISLVNRKKKKEEIHDSLAKPSLSALLGEGKKNKANKWQKQRKHQSCRSWSASSGCRRATHRPTLGSERLGSPQLQAEERGVSLAGNQSLSFSLQLCSATCFLCESGKSSYMPLSSLAISHIISAFFPSSKGLDPHKYSSKKNILKSHLLSLHPSIIWKTF